LKETVVFNLFYLENVRRQQTRNDVGVECRHDMRPSVQLPSVSGVDSKLGHRKGLGLACSRRLGRPGRDPPLVSKYVRQICGNFLGVFDILLLWPFEQKLARRLLLSPKRFMHFSISS